MSAPDLLAGALTRLAKATQELEDAHDYSDLLEPQAQADAIALVQDLRQRIGLVEADLAAILGKAAGKHQGNLSDGRQFALTRSADRKEWDHDSWKHDVRRVLTDQILDRAHLPRVATVVDPESGEALDGISLGGVIQQAITEAQAVHGATSPKSTSLKALGLYVGDYCTSSPGGWRLNAVKPTQPATPETATDSGE